MLLSPMNLFALAAIGAVLFYGLGHSRGRGGALAMAFLLLSLLVLPLGQWLAAPLENRFSMRPVTGPVDGILVMGGSINRTVRAAQLARNYPSARVVITGVQFAADGARLLQSLGVARERLVVEGQSRDSWNDLVLAKAMAAPRPGQTWFLVTSAVHMPRAMGVAQHLGWPMTPAPVEYLSRPPKWFNVDVIANSDAVNRALHEYLGLAAYRLEGRTDALFPRPQAP